MSVRPAFPTSVIAFALLLAACGGAPAATPTSPATTAGPTPTTAATPGDPGQPTPPPGGSAQACALVSVQEWAAVTGLNVTGAMTLDMSPPTSGCIYQTDTDPAGSISVSPNGGMWELIWISSASDLPEVPGIGDGAVWEANSAALVVLKGDWIVSFTAGSGRDELETRLEWAKQLAQLAVGRL